MPCSAQTLLGYLSRPNPHLTSSSCAPGTVTGSNKKQANPWDVPKDIVRWEDFDFNALESIYGGALHDLLERSLALEDFTIPAIPFCQICDENSLDSLIVKWNQSVVSSALSASQSHLETRLKTGKIYMVKGGQALWPSDDKHQLRPDWAAIKACDGIDRIAPDASNILPGETKLGRKWSSIKMNPGEKLEESDFKKAWLQPMSQIFTYCVRNNALYGYILTDKELVAVRVAPTTDEVEFDSQRSLESLPPVERKRPSNKKISAEPAVKETEPPDVRAKNSGTIEFKSIPWRNDAHGTPGSSRVMTVNLALWWLHMMAAEDSAIQDSYSPLGSAEWNQKVETPKSSFTDPENSQQDGPIHSSPHFEPLSIETRQGAKKRSRRHVEDTVIEQGSPPKRQTRSQR